MKFDKLITAIHVSPLPAAVNSSTPDWFDGWRRVHAREGGLVGSACGAAADWSMRERFRGWKQVHAEGEGDDHKSWPNP